MIEENPVLPSEELVDNNTTDINVLMLPIKIKHMAQQLMKLWKNNKRY